MKISHLNLIKKNLRYTLCYLNFLQNMFLAIINDTYAEVKEDVTNKPAEFSMGDFFSTGVNNVKGSMGIVDRY